VCQRNRIENAGPICQCIPGHTIDDAVGTLLLEAITPTALEVALRVRRELQRRLDEVDQLHQQRVERARYEAELARRRFMQLDPDNRLVADALEAEWNALLREHHQAQEHYEKLQEASRRQLSGRQRDQIVALAADVPALWRDPKTPQRDRKRMGRLLLEDVTLIKADEITVHVRFKGGATHSLRVPLPLSAGKMRQTPKAQPTPRQLPPLRDRNHPQRCRSHLRRERRIHPPLRTTDRPGLRPEDSQAQTA